MRVRRLVAARYLQSPFQTRNHAIMSCFSFPFMTNQDNMAHPGTFSRTRQPIVPHPPPALARPYFRGYVCKLPQVRGYTSLYCRRKLYSELLNICSEVANIYSEVLNICSEVLNRVFVGTTGSLDTYLRKFGWASEEVWTGKRGAGTPDKSPATPHILADGDTIVLQKQISRHNVFYVHLLFLTLPC